MAISNELRQKMIQRGNEKLSETRRFESFDGTINTENGNYTFNKDFFLGDYVTIYSKELNKKINAQIVSVTKSISDGIEYLDIIFGYDRLSIKKMFDK